jgi:hypothetical protein
MSKREWSASDQIQRHGDEAISSCFDLIKSGIGGLNNNSVEEFTAKYKAFESEKRECLDNLERVVCEKEETEAQLGDSNDQLARLEEQVFATNPKNSQLMIEIEEFTSKYEAFESEKRECTDKLGRIVCEKEEVEAQLGESYDKFAQMINKSLSTWSQESRDYLAEIAKNIEEGDIIYWVQGLCANREKSLALGERGLEGFDRAKCPSANFNDNALNPVAASLRAKIVYCNIRDVCIRKDDNCNCMPATHEEAETDG